MRKIYLFAVSAFLVSFSLSSFAQKPVDKRLAGLDTAVSRILKDWHAPGVSIAVVEKKQVIFVGGFGYSDLQKKTPVTENTLFAIGSCTKAFTASMVGMLQEEGKVDIDKPVRNYLPELKFQNEYTNAHATARDMMTHRTGVPRHDQSWYGSTASRTELLKRIEFLEPSAELRERYQYNNFMFMSLGVLVEKLTGKSWEENMRERILRPLQMNNTVLSIGEMEKSPDHSLAYAVLKDSIITPIPFRNIDAIGPAGSINSCSKDMANWLITWINRGNFQGKQIFPAWYRDQAITSQMATGGGVPDNELPDIHTSGYGLAWGMFSYRGHYRVQHGGGIDGFITATLFFPSDSIGIFVVSNQGQPTGAISNWIADRMLKLPYRNWDKVMLDEAKKAKSNAKQQPKSDSLNRHLNTTPSHPLADYAGIYSNPGYSNFSIELRHDSLYAKYNAYDIQLQHFHYDQFNAKVLGPLFEDDNPILLSFLLNNRGDVDRFTAALEAGVKDIEFKKQPKIIALGKSDLDKYTGEYELSGIAVKVYTKKDSTLFLFVTGQPEYELIPVGKDEFNLKGMTGYSVKFDVSDKGEATALYSIQPNGTFKATRKKK